ncbi:MAG: multi-sensor hybrid histidine kinase [uncultured bacterium]|nr:MAG: multi-sensor hybrid histidine kinase [uncultured bacterium]
MLTKERILVVDDSPESVWPLVEYLEHDYQVKPFSLSVVKARIKSALRLKEEMDNRTILTRKLEDLNKNLEKRVQEKTVALKQANEELQANEKRYRTLYETAIEGIFEVTPEGRMLSASPSLARILGYESPQEMVGVIGNVAQQLYVHPRDRERFVAELEKHGEISDFETRFFKKQGDIIWVLICARKNCDESGREPTYQGFLIDITQRKQSQLKNRQHLQELRLLEKQYFQAQKMEAIGTLTGGVAHDFNNILTVILGVAELMRRQIDAASPLLPKLEQISAAAQRAVNLVRQLLAFSRQQILQPRRLNMNEVLSQFEKMIRRVIGEDIRFSRPCSARISAW